MMLAAGGAIAAAVARPPPPPLVRCGARKEAESAEFKMEAEGDMRRGMLGFGLGGAAGKKKKKRKKEKVEVVWQCARGCGACCKLDKGPAFPAPEEIFADDPSHLQLYKSLIGPDGWCVHYHHPTRTCSIYPDRPFFCRVEPAVFRKLYGIDERRFNREACSSCRDTIKAVYGSGSEELKNFDRLTRNPK
ncbi:uncharacterized protein LOC103721056 isoform X1 [Phoenix dactylifera]|uniref:Uncharacterized protein LOC103721056 isoform X1 n=1 Tax=Phoenix dactylifera TaxID=42345 RepID=A0A8B8JBW2_PHODC|nr:uncharacterized protein LOC103721056 isoform X1 [Phoenix dactylifera]